MTQPRLLRHQRSSSEGLAVGNTGRMIVDCAAYIDGRRVDLDPSPESLAGWCATGEGFVWIGMRMPSPAELQPICDALDLDDVPVAEILAPHSRPVLEIEGATTQMVLRTARYDDPQELIVLGEMTLLIGQRAVVSIRHGQASPLSQLRVRLEADPDRLRDGPAAVAAAIIGRVIDDYSPALDGFENDAVEAERDVFSETRHQPVKRLYQLKREVRELLVAVDSLHEPLARLIRHIGPTLPADVQTDLNEASDQLDRAVTRSQSLSGLLDAAMTASLAQISVQQNEDMRKISAWVAIAAVPTMVAGIYGMNFEHMPELGHPASYPVVVGGMAVVAVWMYRAFKRSGWL